jgi:RNA polymerase sigma-70 factor (ECF subfamily)
MAIEPVRIPTRAASEPATLPRRPMDLAAFAKAFDADLLRIYAFVARRIDDRSAAEELTTRVFERALGAVQRSELERADVGAFLYRVAANAIVDHARRARRSIPTRVRASDMDQGTDRVDAEAISDEAAVRGFSAAIDRAALRRALVDLREHDRRVILLKYFDGLAPDELGAALGASPAAFQEQLEAAMEALRSALAEGTDAA